MMRKLLVNIEFLILDVMISFVKLVWWSGSDRLIVKVTIRC